MIPKNLFEEVRLRFKGRVVINFQSCFGDKELKINSAGRLKSDSVLLEISTGITSLEPCARICFLVLWWRHVVERDAQYSRHQKRVPILILERISASISEIKQTRLRVQLLSHLLEHEVSNADTLLRAVLEEHLFHCALGTPEGYMRRAVVDLALKYYWVPVRSELLRRRRLCTEALRAFCTEAPKAEPRLRVLRIRPYHRPSPGSKLTGTFD